MFTVVVDKYNFGQDNWNFRYKSFQKKIKKIFKGYDYIAICSDGAKGTVFHTNSDSIIVDDKIYWTIEGLMEI